jgi:hypothetical protein
VLRVHPTGYRYTGDASPSAPGRITVIYKANADVPAGVKATVREGYVFLTGMVRHSAQRVAAEDTAAGVAGVLGITNEIDISVT